MLLCNYHTCLKILENRDRFEAGTAATLQTGLVVLNELFLCNLLSYKDFQSTSPETVQLFVAVLAYTRHHVPRKRC